MGNRYEETFYQRGYPNDKYTNGKFLHTVKLHTENTMRYHFILSKKSAGTDAEKLNVSYITHGNLTWYSQSKTYFGIFK